MTRFLFVYNKIAFIHSRATIIMCSFTFHVVVEGKNLAVLVCFVCVLLFLLFAVVVFSFLCVVLFIGAHIHPAIGYYSYSYCTAAQQLLL